MSPSKISVLEKTTGMIYKDLKVPYKIEIPLLRSSYVVSLTPRTRGKEMAV